MLTQHEKRSTYRNPFAILCCAFTFLIVQISLRATYLVIFYTNFKIQPLASVFVVKKLTFCKLNHYLMIGAVTTAWEPYGVPFYTNVEVVK